MDDDIDKDGGGDDKEDVVIKSGGIEELFRLKWREKGVRLGNFSASDELEGTDLL